MGEDDRRTVRLNGVPVGIARAIAVYRNDMIRELQLIELGRQQGIEEPSQLYDLAEQLRADLVWLRDDLAGHTVWSDPAAAPSERVDMVIEATVDASARMLRAIERFEELNQLSRYGQLLTEEATPAMMQVIRWVGEELAGQLNEGRAPRPCLVATA